MFIYKLYQVIESSPRDLTKHSTSMFFKSQSPWKWEVSVAFGSLSAAAVCCCPETRQPVRGPLRARHGAVMVPALSERLPVFPRQAKGHSVGEGWAAWLEAPCGSGSPAVAGQVGLAPKMALAASETPLQGKQYRKSPFTLSHV